MKHRLLVCIALLFGILLFSIHRIGKLERELRLERGDEVEIVLQSPSEIENQLFADCRVIYIDGVATSVGNMVLLTLNDCSHSFMKNKPIYPELRPRETIRKKSLGNI